MTAPSEPTQKPRFPWLLLALLFVGLAGTMTMRELVAHSVIGPVIFWEGVIVFGIVAGVAGWGITIALDDWWEARRTPGKVTWWDRIPRWMR